MISVVYSVSVISHISLELYTRHTNNCLSLFGGGVYRQIESFDVVKHLPVSILTTLCIPFNVN